MSANKKTRLFNSRAIRTELADPAYTDGVLLVPDFLRTREFEIRLFELSQLNTKYASSTRVFQKLPRVLRRRAASHNVKRVPKRLRRRALREMALETPAPRRATGRSVYQAKMTSRLLRLAARLKARGQLPADAVYDHARLQNRVREASQQLKTLVQSRSSRSLNNVVGSYDNTGTNRLAERPRGNLKYFKRQKQFVWLPTHVWHAKRCHMMKRWGYQIPLSPTQKCFRAVNRASKQETVMFDTSYFGTLVVDCADGDELKTLYRRISRKQATRKQLEGLVSYTGPVYRDEEELGPGTVYCNGGLNQMLVRVHPAIYEDLFTHVAAIKQPATAVQDCRYSLGSIELVGPKSLNALNKVFHTTLKNELWTNLLRFNEQNIPSGTCFSFMIKDPRLYEKPVSPPLKQPMAFNDILIRLNTAASQDTESLRLLFSPHLRNETYRDQLSNKLLHTIVGNRSLVQANATEIPVLLTKLRKSWCVVVPWFWVLPIWLQLHKIKSMQLGGLRQMEQINFENYMRTFPLDYPYLKAGWEEHQLVRKMNREKYQGFPKSKVPPYEKSEIDDPFGCDWEFLRNMSVLRPQHPELDKSQRFGEFEGIKKQIHTENDLIETCNAMKSGKLSVLNRDQSTDKIRIEPAWIELRSGPLKDNARIYDSESQLLIGYVIRGAINLHTGKATGLGYICGDYNKPTVLVRNVGASKNVEAIVI